MDTGILFNPTSKKAKTANIVVLLGSIASGFFGRKIGVSGAQIITCTAVVTTTILAVLA
jgi:NADH-ubiquinone oxidoreductase chain 5